MLSKGGELFQFEADLFKLKQKYFNEKMTEEKWKELMTDGNTLLTKYRNMGDMIEYYTFNQFATYVDFLDRKEMNDYHTQPMRQGLLALPN